MRNGWRFALLASLVGTSAARGDILRPVEGGEIQAPATIQGDEVILTTPAGIHRFPRSDFRSIETVPDPARDWPARRDVALKKGAPERLEAALWALEFGLVPECEAMVRAAHEADPANRTAARMVAVADRLKAPLPDPDLSPLLRDLPADHRIARGPHVLLIHQHPEVEAAERVELLERVIAAYYLLFASYGMDLPAPAHRLSSMWFAHKSDYLNYLRAEGATAFLTTRGYTHPTRGLVVAHDARDDPPRRRARDSLLAARADLDQAEARARSLPPGARVRLNLRGQARTTDRSGADRLIGQLRRELERQELNSELSRREIDWGVAAHETIHQLVAASRLSPRPDAWPRWLQEGLAMQFEPISAGHWAGPGPAPTHRLHDFRDLKIAPDLRSTVSNPGFCPGYDPSDYARAWAAVYHLRTEHPRQFIALLDALALPSSGPMSPADRATSLLSPLLNDAENVRWRASLDPPPTPANPTIPRRICIDRAATDDKMQRSHSDRSKDGA